MSVKNRTSGQKIQIGLLRDSQEKMSKLGVFLQKKGFQPIFADNPTAMRHHIGEIDCVVVPPLLVSEKSGMSACLELRADTDPGSLPLLVLSASKDRAIIDSFYNSGANVVHVLEGEDADFQYDLVYLQIRALATQKRELLNKLTRQIDSEAKSALLYLLGNSLNDCLLILSEQGELLYSNRKAEEMVSKHHKALEAEIKDALKQLGPPSSPEGSGRSYSRLTVFSAAEEKFYYSMEIVLVEHASNFYFLIALRPVTSDWNDTASADTRAARHYIVRLLALAGAAIDSNIIKGGETLSISEHIAGLDKALASKPVRLERLLGLLLDALDHILPPGITFKIDLSDDLEIATSQLDTLLFLSELIFFSADLLKPSGLTVISAEKEGRNKASLTFTLESKTLSQNLRGRGGTTVWDEDSIRNQRDLDSRTMEGKLAHIAGMAGKHGMHVEYKTPSDMQLKLRILIPLKVE